MTTSQEDRIFERVVHKFDPQSELLRSWEMKGGVSAQVTALETVRPDGQTQKMIVRQYGEFDFKHNPQIAADEFRLLQQLRSAGLAVPAPYYLDQSGEIFSTPYVVIEYIEGQPEFAPSSLPDYIQQFAMHLYRIHQVDCSKLDISFLPRQEKKYAEKLRKRSVNLDKAGDEVRMRDMLKAAWPLARRNTDVLLHGDFWPGNTLWKDGQLVAIIDWEEAASGDPLFDIASSRLELLWAFGIDAMQSFTRQYQTINVIDFTNLPYWDLCAALRLSQFASWATDDLDEKNMRERRGWFIAQAFAKLSAL